ncbi:MAG: hypothetical protein IJZ57_08135 [Clostridia bacterium]|nr:hypothetical protein [Clostridia bacterium]
MKRKPLPLAQSVFFVILCIFIGTVCISDVLYRTDEVTKEECTYIETQFVDYHETIKAKGNHSRGITIYCSDGEKYEISPKCINDMLRDDISELNRNSDITLLLYPESDTIVELTADNAKLLDFDESIKNNRKGITIFLLLGIFMYIGALAFLVDAIINIKIERKKKHHKAV